MKLMSGVLKDAQHLEGVIIKISTGKRRVVKILEYHSKDVFSLVIMDKENKTATVLNKTRVIILYEDSVGRNNAKVLGRLPNNTKKHIEEMLN